jgi:TPR repeat protein
VGKVTTIKIKAKDTGRDEYFGGSGGSGGAAVGGMMSATGEWGGSTMAAAAAPSKQTIQTQKSSSSVMDDAMRRARDLSKGTGRGGGGDDALRKAMEMSGAMEKAMEESRKAQEAEDLLLEQIMAASMPGSGPESESPEASKLAVLEHAPKLMDTKPEDVSGIKGDVIELTVVTYIGTAPLKYEWFRNGEPAHPNRDSPSYQVTLNEDYAGQYRCKVSNKLGVVESRTAVVKIVSMMDKLKQGGPGGDKKKKKKKKRKEEKEEHDAFVWDDPLGDLPASISLASGADGVELIGPDRATLKTFPWDEVESFTHKTFPSPELCDAFSFTVKGVGTYTFECDSYEPFDDAFRAGKSGNGGSKAPGLTVRSLHKDGKAQPAANSANRICDRCQHEFFSASGRSTSCMDCREDALSVGGSGRAQAQPDLDALMDKAKKQGELKAAGALNHNPLCEGCGHEFFSASGRSLTCMDCRQAVSGPSKFKSRGSTAASLGSALNIDIKAKMVYEEAEGWYSGCGKGVDLQRAAKLFTEAAELGWAPAAAGLATCYGRGRGTQENHGEARKWYARSQDMGLLSMAKDGCRSAQYWYGYASKDRLDAIRWHTSAAELGHSNAQHSLGMAYAGGLAVKKDYAMAAMWYEKAAKQGNVRAQHCFGKLLMEGKGIARDLEQSASYLEKAILQGHNASEKELHKVHSLMAQPDLGPTPFDLMKEAEEKQKAESEAVEQAKQDAEKWRAKEAAEKEAEEAAAKEAAEKAAREAEERAVKAAQEAARKQAEEQVTKAAEERTKKEAEDQAAKAAAIAASPVPAPERATLNSQPSEYDMLKLEIERLKMENMKAELARLKAENKVLTSSALVAKVEMCSVCGKPVDDHTDAELDACIDEEERQE